MLETVYVLGGGQTRFGELWDYSLTDLIRESLDWAIGNTKGLPTDIDTVVIGNMLGGETAEQAHLGTLVSGLLPHHPPALRVEAACASGWLAVHTACALLESGKAETVLVVGAEKMTDVAPEVIAAGLMGAADAEKDAPSGLTFPGIFGLIATRYIHEYGLTRERLNYVSARHHKNAVSNPFAQFRSAIAPEKIAEAPLVADPLTLL